jgi:hypothetical protein
MPRREGVEQVEALAIAGPVPQHEVDAKTAVQPGDAQQGELAVATVVRPDPPDDGRVIVLPAVQFVGEAGAHEMRGQQERNAQAQCDPHQFERRHAQGAPVIEGGERE